MENDLNKLVRVFDVMKTVTEQVPERAYDVREKARLDRQLRAIMSIPAVDAVEVKHASWLSTDAYPHNVYCSDCYKTYVQAHWQIWQDKPGDGGIERNYCPHCGARMDGRREDGEA